jgi:hypothetical protein
LFCIASSAPCARFGRDFVQVFRPDRGIGQHGHARGLHFEEAALDEDELVLRLTGQLDAHGAWP